MKTEKRPAKRIDENKGFWQRDKRKFPVVYNGKEYKKKECKQIFLNFYKHYKNLNDNGGVYLSEGLWVYPDGSLDE